MLELKESNSPFWLIGVGKNKTFAGSGTNIPCYYKSYKKQEELAKQIFKNDKNVEDVYLITGTQWDNMPSGGKEEFGYIKNKGKLILSKNEIMEADYPKGVSRDPLPKKGVKVYTSPATALEDKGEDKKMKLELNDECIINENSTSNLLTKDELQKLRNEIVIGSIYLSDYDNSFNINPKYVMDLFDGYVEDTWEKILEYRNDYFADKSELSNEELFKSEIENIDSLYDYYTSIEDNLVVKNPLNEAQKKLIPNLNEDSKLIKEAVPWKAIATGAMYAVDNWDTLKDMIETIKETSTDVYNKVITIFNYLKSKNANPKDAAKDIANMVAAEESLTEGATKLEKGEGDTFENAGETWKVIKQNAEDTLVVALDKDGNEKDRYVVAWGLQKDNSWNQGHYFTDKDKAMKYFNEREKKQESLKESKIVTPVGNPQTAGSFVNIDVDLDHMEVSDFIVRLAQAIRSEQTAVLEYVALMSANGITNEDRTVIEGVMKEEKNHMCALTALLYKQILMNHKENVDEANDEFTLPKFGSDIFDENNKLTESISTILNKIITESSHDGTDDEYTVGDRESGRIYNGLQQTLDVIKNLISTSGEEVVVQNVTLSDDRKMVKESNMNIDDLINELKTDTNYDELAYHIHEYSKVDKKKALELMDLLFDLETNKSPKECRDEIINHLTIKEDISITSKDDKYNIEIDVEYDSDVANQIFDNISREVEEYNKNNKINLSDLGLKDGKFYFTVNKEVDEETIKDICTKLFDKATNYEYQIIIA